MKENETKLGIQNYIRENYASENEQTLLSLSKIVNFGPLGGTGKMVILPVDQGFEHGPHKSFNMNRDAFDPLYHYDLAVDSGFNAIAAPLGMLECINSHRKTTDISLPTILKINSNDYFTSLSKEDPDQAITANVADALRLNCTGIGITIYPGSKHFQQSVEKIRPIIQEAKKYGLAIMMWAYPRGSLLDPKSEQSDLNEKAKENLEIENLSSFVTNSEKDSHNAVDVISYAAHIACLLGAHIIKTKLPNPKVLFAKNLKLCESAIKENIDLIKEKSPDEPLEAVIGMGSAYPVLRNEEDLFEVVRKRTHSTLINEVIKSCFNGRRMVIFSGGEYTEESDLLRSARAITMAGGNGLIIGRNSFQRKREDAIELVEKMIHILKNGA